MAFLLTSLLTTRYCTLCRVSEQVGCRAKPDSLIVPFPDLLFLAGEGFLLRMKFSNRLIGWLWIAGIGLAMSAMASAAPQPRFIGAEGKILPADGFLRLAPPWGGSPVVEELRVERGSVVKQGQVLAVFSDRGLRQQELDLAQSEVAAAEAVVARIEATQARQRAEMDAEQERLAALNADFVWLLGEYSVPRREQVEIEMEQRSIGHERRKLRALMAAAESAVESELAEARARVDAVRQNVVVAQARLDATQLVAPWAGTVLQLLARRGESAAQGLLVMVSEAPPQVMAEVFVSELPALKTGLPVVVTGDGFIGEWRGTVAEISPRVGRNILVEADPLASVDRRVVEVWIDLEEPEQALALLGAQVRVRISRQ